MMLLISGSSRAVIPLRAEGVNGSPEISNNASRSDFFSLSSIQTVKIYQKTVSISTENMQWA